MTYRIDWNVTLDCVDRDALLRRVESGGNFVIVDTIGGYGGNRHRIRGALTIPYPEVADRRTELLGYDEVIVYCREKRCKASKIAASLLKMLKVPNVKVYEGGLDEWMAAGLPVEEVN